MTPRKSRRRVVDNECSVHGTCRERANKADAEIAALLAERDALLEISFQHAKDATRLREAMSKAEEECQEQARLNGMGSEREAALMARAEAAESRLAEVIDYARHTHEARYYKNDAGKMVLTDACNKCGMDLRHDVHAALSAPSTPKEGA